MMWWFGQGGGFLHVKLHLCLLEPVGIASQNGGSLNNNALKTLAFGHLTFQPTILQNNILENLLQLWDVAL